MLILSPELSSVIQLVSKEMEFRLHILAPKTNALNHTVPPMILELPLSEVVWDGRPRTKPTSGLLPAFVQKFWGESSYAHLLMS